MRLRRRRDDEESPDQALLEDAEPGDAASGAPGGPYDVSEVDDLDEHVDLGSLLIRPADGTELRLQLDEETGDVLAVLLVDEEGMLEVRAFAAPRNGDLWADVRREIAADTARRGGTATEASGPFGPELHCQVPVQLEDGSGGVQPSRVIGHNGDRWFLRAALMGRPAMEPETGAAWEDMIRAIVVRRGADPLPPGEALPLHLPPEAHRMA